MVAMGFPFTGFGDRLGRPARAGDRRDRVGGAAIIARREREIFPLEQFIRFELHQHVIAQTRARHAVSGQRLFGTAFQGRKHVLGQRRPHRGQPPPAVSLLLLAAALFARA
jgi:hypothetical protein